MPRGRPVEALVLDDAEKTQLLRLANARSLPNGLVRRAQIVLACARGEPNLPLPDILLFYSLPSLLATVTLVRRGINQRFLLVVDLGNL